MGLTFLTDGNHGFGTQNPSFTLEVDGTFKANTTTPVFGAYTLTIPKTGTAVVGTGTAGRIAEWVTDTNTLQASTLAKTGAGVLTLAAAGNYTLTVAATGIISLVGHTHAAEDIVSGILGDDRAPQFLKTDGSRALTGNLAVDAGITIDGVDISVFKASYDTHIANVNAHHARDHALDGATHTGTLAWASVNKTGSALADLATRPHSALTGIGINDHHARDHALSGATHTASGLSVGHVVRATGATTFIWAQLQHSDLGGVSIDQHHARDHALDGATHTGTLAWVSVNKTGSALADLATRPHSALTGIGIDDHHARDHALDGATHTGTLADVQAPQFLKTDGSRDLTGDQTIDANVKWQWREGGGVLKGEVYNLWSAVSNLSTQSMNTLNYNASGRAEAILFAGTPNSDGYLKLAATSLVSPNTVLSFYVGVTRIFAADKDVMVFDKPVYWPSGGSAGAPTCSFVGDTDTGLYRYAANKMALVGNSQIAVVVDGSSGAGRLGIGNVGSPLSTAHVGGDARIDGDLIKKLGANYYTGYTYVPLSTPLTSTSWDGDDYSSTGAPVLIDLSAVFGVPANVKAVVVYVAATSNLAWGTTGLNVGFGPSSTYWHQFICTTFGGSIPNRMTGFVNCNANGDIYYNVSAGGSTLGIYLRIWGYFV